MIFQNSELSQARTELKSSSSGLVRLSFEKLGSVRFSFQNVGSGSVRIELKRFGSVVEISPIPSLYLSLVLLIYFILKPILRNKKVAILNQFREMYRTVHDLKQKLYA